MKREKTMTIETKLSVIEFVSTVNSIALEYFDDAGNYTPHIGLLNAMRVFYNTCVKESKHDTDHPHNIDDAVEIGTIAEDDEFIESFNKAIQTDRYALDFATAYNEAISIVEQKKYTMQNIIDVIKKSLLEIIDNMNDILTPENIENIAKITKSINNNENEADVLGLVENVFGKIISE